MASGLFSTHSTYLTTTAAAVAVPSLFMGLACLIKPRLGLIIFDFAPPSTKTPEGAAGAKLVENLMLLYAVRDAVLSGITLLAWHNKDRRTLGQMMLGGAVVVLVDGYASLRQLGKGQWLHWMFVPIMVPVGSALLGWI